MRANWHVYRKTLTNANTQYSQVIRQDAYAVSVKEKNGLYNFRLSLIADQVEAGDEYLTILGGQAWESPKKMFGDRTIYLSSDTAGIEIEIEEWT